MQADTTRELRLSPTIVDTVVTARAIHASIDGRAVLSGINLTLPRATAIGVIGINGAGKTTLLKVLSRLLPIDKGELTLLGTRFAGRSLATPSSVRARIGVIGHALMLYQDLTVMENLRFFGRLYGLKGGEERASQLLHDLGLADRRDTLIRSLSRGMAQRVAIARAFLHNPELMLADEPFTGLDARGAEALERCIQGFCDRGGTIVMAEHDVDRCLRLCDRVLALGDGCVALEALCGNVDAGFLSGILRGYQR